MSEQPRLTQPFISIGCPVDGGTAYVTSQLWVDGGYDAGGGSGYVKAVVSYGGSDYSSGVKGPFSTGSYFVQCPSSGTLPDTGGNKAALRVYLYSDAAGMNLLAQNSTQVILSNTSTKKCPAPPGAAI
jgi:hypothetical protein